MASLGVGSVGCIARQRDYEVRIGIGSGVSGIIAHCRQVTLATTTFEIDTIYLLLATMRARGVSSEKQILWCIV